MGGGVGHQRGGILGLHRLLDEHGEAIRYDLLALGRDLDELGDSLSWVDLRAVVRHSPRTAALARAVHGEGVDWDAGVHLLATAVDLLASGNWQRGGGKGVRPKPLKRPQEKRRIGTTVLTLDEMDKLLGYSPRRA